MELNKTKIFRNSCLKLKEADGNCTGIDCTDCPFSKWNDKTSNGCRRTTPSTMQNFEIGIKAIKWLEQNPTKYEYKEPQLKDFFIGIDPAAPGPDLHSTFAVWRPYKGKEEFVFKNLNHLDESIDALLLSILSMRKPKSKELSCAESIVKALHGTLSAKEYESELLLISNILGDFYGKKETGNSRE